MSIYLPKFRNTDFIQNYQDAGKLCRLNKHEKIQLGKEIDRNIIKSVSRILKAFWSKRSARSRELYLIKRAEKYCPVLFAALQNESGIASFKVHNLSSKAPWPWAKKHHRREISQEAERKLALLDSLAGLNIISEADDLQAEVEGIRENLKAENNKEVHEQSWLEELDHECREKEKKLAEFLSEARTRNYRKREFLASLWTDISKIPFVYSQAKNFPLMRRAFQNLKDSCCNWNWEASEEIICSLKMRIANQMANIGSLFTLLASGHRSLTQLQEFDGFDLEPYFSGDRIFNASDVEELQGLIANFIQNHSFDKVQDAYPFTVNSKCIQMQASLFDVSRKAAEWTLRDNRLKLLSGPNLNKVYPITLKDGEAPIAYFKQGSKNEDPNREDPKSNAYIEQMIWDLAGLIGLEDWFVPCKKTALPLPSGNQIEGLIQLAQPGELLMNIIDNKEFDKISDSELANGNLISSFFSMFDAHSKNLLFFDGKIKFFDNLRSLPHSNGLILTGSSLRSVVAFRTALLAFPNAYVPLKVEERAQISQLSAQFREKFPAIQQFLDKSERGLNLLPPGWFYKEEVLEALEERLIRLESFISNNETYSLRDLIFTIQPEFKFFLAMEVLTTHKTSLLHKTHKEILEDERNASEFVGTQCYDDLLNAFLKLEVDPVLLFKAVNDPSRNFEDLLVEFSARIGLDKSLDPEKTEEELYDLFPNIRIDLKDTSRKEALNLAKDCAIMSLKKFNLWSESSLSIANSNQAKDYVQIKHPFFLTYFENDELKLGYQTFFENFEAKAFDLNDIGCPRLKEYDFTLKEIEWALSLTLSRHDLSGLRRVIEREKEGTWALCEEDDKIWLIYKKNDEIDLREASEDLLETANIIINLNLNRTFEIS